MRIEPFFLFDVFIFCSYTDSIFQQDIYDFLVLSSFQAISQCVLPSDDIIANFEGVASLIKGDDVIMLSESAQLGVVALQAGSSLAIVCGKLERLSDFIKFMRRFKINFEFLIGKAGFLVPS